MITAGNPGSAFGASLAYDNDANLKIVRALVADLNARGGIAGRTIDPVYAFNDNTNQDAENQSRQQNATCTQLTEDDKVFMVISLNTGGLNYSYDCYASHQTALIEGSLISADQTDFDKRAPWLVAPVYMNFSRMARLLPAELKAQGFLTKHMGLISYDRVGLKRSAQKTLIPRLESLGGVVEEQVYLKTTYDGLASGISNAVLKFKGKIDRVVMWAPEGGALLLFARGAESQGYRPRYAVTTYDAPALVQANVPASQLKGAVGVGFLTARDLSDGAAPGLYPRERDCFNIVNERAGQAFTSRRQSPTSGFALAACELIWFARGALAPARGVSIGNADVARYVYALKSSYDPVMTVGSQFSAGKLDGVSVFKHLAFDDDCACFMYRGAWRNVPS